MKKYTSSLGQGSVILTIFIVCLTLFIIFSGLSAYRRNGDVVYALMHSLGAVILFTLTIAMYLYMPRSVTITDTGITVDRMVAAVNINFQEIQSVRLLGEGEMDFVVRTFGNGGLFGYTGKYYNKKLGSMTWYCTQRNNYILIEELNGKKIIITPDDPGGFMRELETTQPSLVR